MKRLLLMLCLMATAAHALNFGSAAKQDSVIAADGAARFELLLWTSDPELNVSLSARAPEGWSVVIEPAELAIGHDIGSEFVSSGMRASTASVIALPPAGAAGSYLITVHAVAGAPAGDINFFQERVFALSVRVEGDEPAPTTTTETPTTTTIAAVSDEKRGNDDGPVYMFLVAVILAVSLMIYRH